MVGSRRALMVGLLMLVTAVAFEAQAVSTAMPAVAADLGRLDLYAWAFTAFMIPQILAIVLGGRLCDDLGPVRPVKIGVVVFAVGIVLSATAISMPMFLVRRFVQGFGGGLINVSLMVVVGRAFPPQDTGRVMAWFSYAWMLPSFVGPTASAWIVRAASWHFVFWAVLPLALVGFVLLTKALAHVHLPALHDEDAPPPASLWAAGLAALGVGAVQGASVVPDWLRLVLIAVGAACIVVSLRPLMPAGWRPFAAGLPAVIAARALVTGAFFEAIAFLPLMLNHLRGEPLEVGGYVLTVASLGWTLGSWLQSRHWLRLSRDAIVSVGVAACVVGLTIASACTFLPAVPLWVLVVGMSATGVGMGMSSSSTSILVMQLSDAHALGRNTSSLQVGETMGNAVVVAVAGTIFALLNARGEQVASFAVPSVLVAVIALVALVFSRRIGHVPNLSARP